MIKRYETDATVILLTRCYQCADGYMNVTSVVTLKDHVKYYTLYSSKGESAKNTKSGGVKKNNWIENGLKH